MKKHIETLIELVEALSQPKATIVSVASAGIASTATIGRWQRESRADPAGYTFEHDGVVAPLHIHMAAAQRVGFARFISGERPPSKPLRHRVRQVVQPGEIEDDMTADAPAAPEPAPMTISATRHRSVEAKRDVAELAAAPVETPLQRDLRERVEARARGETMPPIAPVHTAAPSPRYVSPEERSEGIGAGIVRPGGFKTA